MEELTETSSLVSNTDTMDPCPIPSPSQDLLAELNNEGASQMEMGEYSEAISVLCMALNLAMTRRSDNLLNVVSRAAGNIEINRSTPNHSAPTTTASSSNTRSSSVASMSQRPRRQRRTSSSDTSSNSHEASKNQTRSTSRSQRRRRPAQDKSALKTEKDKSTNTHDELHSSALSLDATTPSVFVTEDKIVDETRKGDAEYPSTHFVYDKPLRVMDRFRPPSMSELTLYVVYNLGLVFQLQALRCQEKRVHKKRKKPSKTVIMLWKSSVQWYTFCQVLLHQQQQQNEDDDEEDEAPSLSATYTVALWNNLAQAHWYMQRSPWSPPTPVPETEECLQNMLTIMICMIDHGCIRDVENIDSFIENAAHLLLHPQHQQSSTMTATAA